MTEVERLRKLVADYQISIRKLEKENAELQAKVRHLEREKTKTEARAEWFESEYVNERFERDCRDRGEWGIFG